MRSCDGTGEGIYNIEKYLQNIEKLWKRCRGMDLQYRKYLQNIEKSWLVQGNGFTISKIFAKYWEIMISAGEWIYNIENICKILRNNDWCRGTDLQALLLTSPSASGSSSTMWLVLLPVFPFALFPLIFNFVSKKQTPFFSS